MQQFISDSPWSDEALVRTHQRQVGKSLGQADGVLILDGNDYPKQGNDSVGVARQYCGALGKVANCQASVVLCYASQRGHTFLDRRLYLHKRWFGPGFGDRWKRCGIPDGMTFQTKPQLGWDMLAPVIEAGEVPFQWIAMDEGFGRNSCLLDNIDACGKWFFAEIPCSTLVWRRRPKVMAPQAHSNIGRPPTQPRLSDDAPAPLRVEVLANRLRAKRWHRFIIHEGSKGPLLADIAALRVVMTEKGLPARQEWLVIRRTIDPQPEWKYYRSNAPAHTPLQTLAKMTAWRWPVESTIEECKGELGLDHYEVRGWTGWYHHTALTMLSHHFLVSLRIDMGHDAPALTVSQVRRLLQVVLPRRPFDVQAVLNEIERIQRQNYAAYRSHRKRRLRKLNASPPN
jgi:SRSO17 transposase